MSTDKRGRSKLLIVLVISFITVSLVIVGQYSYEVYSNTAKLSPCLLGNTAYEITNSSPPLGTYSNVYNSTKEPTEITGNFSVAIDGPYMMRLSRVGTNNSNNFNATVTVLNQSRKNQTYQLFDPQPESSAKPTISVQEGTTINFAYSIVMPGETAPGTYQVDFNMTPIAPKSSCEFGAQIPIVINVSNNTSA